MLKKVLITVMFLGFFGAALWGVFWLKGKDVKTESGVTAVRESTGNIEETIYKYNAEDIVAGCKAEDKIFCAIERAVKCTLAPDLNGCTAELVPSFVIGKQQEEARPTEISFAISKMKPQSGSNDIAVYTRSDCNAEWFGLCKGTVIYKVTPFENGEWAVTNISVLEP